MRGVVFRGRKVLLLLIGAVLLICVAYFIFSLFMQPSLNRDWSPDQKILAHAEVSGDTVSIQNIRNIQYRSVTDYDVAYYDKKFDLGKLESVWYVVEPFSGHGAGAAHTLVSFGFSDGSYVAISAEIRKQKGETFSALDAFFRQYEIVYVIADERDVIKLRANYRKNDVFLYPMNLSKEQMHTLFIDMLTRANALASQPEFYNTLTNTCATNIVAHINRVVPGRVPWSYKILMPAYSDILARDIGLIDNSLPIDELRAKYRINDKALPYADDPDFSRKIRGL